MEVRRGGSVVKSAELILVLTFLAAGNALGQSSQSEAKIDSLLRLMTLDEKLGQLNQLNAEWDEKTNALAPSQAAMLREGKIGSFLNITGATRIAKIQGIAVKESRLHIPLLFGLDVIHGYRTIFPIPLGEASTWDTALVAKAAHVAADEATSSGIDWTFAPMVDIARDPRWGRIAEGSGEDPVLGSAMAAAKVRGFQGGSLREQGSMIACVKHFAAYGGAEEGRDYNTVDMSERRLREVYLPPYKAALDAGALTVMSAFNDLNGVPCSGNRWLLTDLLRKEWGFNGFVISDWDAIGQLIDHRVAATREDAGVLSLHAGVDVDMMSSIYSGELKSAVTSGRVPIDEVNEAVHRVLRVKFAYGLFDAPFRNCDSTRQEKEILAPEHRKIARREADESIVLLKNSRNILPLDKHTGTIAVIGPLAENRIDPLGPWDCLGNPVDVVTVALGLRERAAAGAKVVYAEGCGIDSGSAEDIRGAVLLAEKADVVVMVLGESRRMSGEAASRTNLGLPGIQQELLKAVCATGKPVVLVLMNGRPLTIPWEAEHCDAIVEAWFPGIEAGNAIADILFGDVNPSGKLPVSFPRSTGQIPVYYAHESTGRPANDSDRFTSKFLDSPNTPLFDFGYGLSYTTFMYSHLQLSSGVLSKENRLVVSVDVTNDGEREGDEIAEFYIEDLAADVARPVRELKGFQRVSLGPHETRRITFTLSADQLAFYNARMERVTEPGHYRVFVGGSLTRVLEADFSVQPGG